VTNAGGPGVLTTDATIHEGLELAQFSDATKEEFRKNLPKNANINNPVDVIGDARADRYNIALSGAFEDPGVDAVFTILTPQSMTDIDLIAREIAKVSSHYDKPVYASFMGEADVAVGVHSLQRNKIPHYLLPESMAKSMATVYKFTQLVKTDGSKPVAFTDVNKDAATAILNAARSSGKSYLTEEEAIQVLGAYKLPVLDSKLINSAEEAARVAAQIGFPTVMKIISDDIIHKFDVGGVVLDVKSEQEAKEAFKQIMTTVKQRQPEARLKGILVRKMIPTGEEVILGVKRDPAFGAVLMFGLGGIFVEIMKDVTFGSRR
jgi:acetyltransferase